MKVLKAYKFRLEATPEQHERLMLLCETVRFVWNKALDICNQNWELEKKIPTAYTMIKWLWVWKKDPKTGFLSQGNAVALQQKLSDFGAAWKRHFDDLAKLKQGKIKELNAFKKHQLQLTPEQRNLSRKVKFSANWQKQKQRINQLRIKIAACRQDFLHKTSKEINKNHAMVAIENLKVSNISRSAKGTVEKPGVNVKARSGLNKSILDQGWYEFRRQLEYKQYWLSGDVVTVKPHYTNQTCSVCGYVHKNNRTSQAGFKCVACGHAGGADDVNAAKNILTSGHGVLACGSSSLESVTKQEPLRNREKVAV